jgi:hypothetical protein
MLAHARDEESLPRLIEANTGALLNQHANLTQFVLTQLELGCGLTLVGSHHGYFHSARPSPERLENAPQKSCGAFEI